MGDFKAERRRDTVSPGREVSMDLSRLCWNHLGNLLCNLWAFILNIIELLDLCFKVLLVNLSKNQLRKMSQQTWRIYMSKMKVKET